MKQVIMAAVAALTFAGVAQAADAPASTLNGDLRCFAIASMAGAKASTDQQRNYLMGASLYYIGRIKAQSPNISLEGALVATTNGMRIGDIETEAKRCDAEMKVLGIELKSMGGGADKRKS